jgi:hypothetical protein
MTIDNELIRSIRLMKRAKLNLIDTLLEVGCPHVCLDEGCPYIKRLQALREVYAEEVPFVPDNSVR